MGSSESDSTTGRESSNAYYRLLAGSSLFQGIGQYTAGQAQASYTQNVYQTNAQLAEMQAAEVIRRGDIEAAKYGKKVQSLLGSQRARMAAAGIDISAAGTTAAELQKETLTFGYQDIQQIKNNAFREALGIKTQGKLAQIQAELQAKQQRLQGTMSLIQGGLQAASYLYRGSNSGSSQLQNQKQVVVAGKDYSAAYAKAPQMNYTFGQYTNARVGK